MQQAHFGGRPSPGPLSARLHAGTPGSMTMWRPRVSPAARAAVRTDLCASGVSPEAAADEGGAAAGAAAAAVGGAEPLPLAIEDGV